MFEIISKIEKRIDINKELYKLIEKNRYTEESIKDIIKSVNDTKDKKGIEPYVGEVLNITIESLKKDLNYNKDKTMPSMETYGGVMSKRNGTSFALEKLEDIYSEIKASNDKASYVIFKEEIESIYNIREERKKFNSIINDLVIKSDNFYKSKDYKPELIGSSLPVKPYISFIYNKESAIDNRMMASEVVRGLATYKTTISSEYLSYKIKELFSILGKYSNNSSNIGEDTIKELSNISCALISGKEYEQNQQYGTINNFKIYDYSIGLHKIKYYYGSDVTKYYDSYIDFYQDTVNTAEISLGATGDQHAQSILKDITTYTLKNEIFDDMGFILDILINLRKEVREHYNIKNSIATNSKYEEEDISISNKNTIINRSVNIINNVTDLLCHELRIIYSLYEYINDSVEFLKSK